jgi:hypothetical protein
LSIQINFKWKIGFWSSIYKEPILNVKGNNKLTRILLHLQNLKNCLTSWTLVLLFTYPFVTIQADPTNKSVYVSEIQAKKGIQKKLGEKINSILKVKIHSELNKSLVNLDSAYIESYKSSVQNLEESCQPSSCDNWIKTTFLPTHILSGEVEVSGLKLKMTLNLENSKTQTIEQTSTFYIPLNDFEDELELQIVDFFTKKKREAQISQPSEPVLHLTPLLLKDIVPILVTPEFEIEPSNDELKYFTNREASIQKADMLATKNDYTNANVQYKKILSNTPPERTKAKFPKYFEYDSKNLLIRIHNSYFNIIALEVQKLDLTIENRSKTDPSFLEGMKGKYQKIYDSLKDDSNPYVQDTRNLVKHRIEEIEVLQFYNLEKKADEMVQELKFKEALKEYFLIKTKLSSFVATNNSKELKTRIDQKIKKIITYKKAYVLNGARTYCSLAERIFTGLPNKSKNPFTDEQKKIEQKFNSVLQLVEDLFSKGDYIDEEAIEVCKSAFKLAERDVVTLIETKEKIIPREEKSFFANIDGRKFVFPGYWHIREEKGNIKSYLLFYGGITSLLATMATGGIMAKNASDYNNISRLPYYYNIQNYSLFTYSVYTDIQNENNQIQSYNSAKNNFSISAAIFGSFYLLSVLDSTLISREKNTVYNTFLPPSEKVPGGSVQINLKPILSPLSNYRELENQLQMTYVYNF